MPFSLLKTGYIFCTDRLIELIYQDYLPLSCYEEREFIGIVYLMSLEQAYSYLEATFYQTANIL